MRVDPGDDLQRASRRTVGGLGHTRAALVSSEVAIALVLLVSSGPPAAKRRTALRRGRRVRVVERADDADPSHGHWFDPEGATGRFFEQALDHVKRVPGVTNAAMTSQLPLSGDADLYGVFFEPAVPNDPGSERGTFRYAVVGDYFATMGIPLRRGRLLDARDRAGARWSP